MSFARHTSPLLLASTIAVLLSSCTSVDSTSTVPVFEVVETNVEDEAPTAEQLLSRAASAAPVDAAALILEAATLRRDQGDLGGAEDALNRITAPALPPQLRAQVILMRGELAMARNLPREALDLLQESRFPALDALTDGQRASFHETRAKAQFATGAALASALERIKMDALLTIPERRNNHDQIWQALSTISQGQLQSLSANAASDEIRGWYELAIAARSYSEDLDRQLIELQQWRAAWPGHPASVVMPPQMELIETLARERPRQIALLLPLETSAGTVVRDAFMSAYFNLRELGGQVPAVKLYDTTDLSDIRPLHQLARQEGAELIIGPLQKQHVAQLQSEVDLGVPTLALNNVEGQTPASPLLFQFALSPEDEGRQIADKAWQDGHRRVAMLSPEDPGNDAYTRKRDSFRATWEALGGKVVAYDTYRSNFTDSISQMLLLNESSARQRRLNEILRRPVVTQQRRRQDVDFIYLLAPPDAARQIVPSLAYLYAGDIPVYASQDVYSGVAMQANDRDLNGIIFGESPWLLGSGGDIARARQLFPMNTAANLRLQAFGIDAFRLYPRLRLLESGANAQIPGVSGALKLGPNHNIVRELSWATISDGLVREAPAR